MFTENCQLWVFGDLLSFSPPWAERRSSEGGRGPLQRPATVPKPSFHFRRQNAKNLVWRPVGRLIGQQKRSSSQRGKKCGVDKPPRAPSAGEESAATQGKNQAAAPYRGLPTPADPHTRGRVTSPNQLRAPPPLKEAGGPRTSRGPKPRFI